MATAKRRARTRTERQGEPAGARLPAWRRLLRRLEAPAATAPLDLRREWLHPAAIFALVLALYAATASRTVCLEDDGLFILSARGLGLPQPPGYPLLVLLGKLFSLLPLGSLAYRVHLVSAVCGAATCAVLWLVLQLLFRDRLASWAGALLLGVSAEFWSQAIIAEVYTLHTLLFFTTLYLVLDFGATRRPRTLYLLSAAYGLSLADHWPLMGLATPCLALALLPRWREVVPRLHKAAGLSLLCAALPYAWMVWRSHQHPEISFYGPIGGLKEFWYFFSRQGFGEVDTSETAGAADRLRFFGYLLRECGRQFTVAGAALAAVGLWASFGRLPRALALALLAGFLGSSFVLLLLLSFDYEVLYQSVFRVYPLVAYGVMVVWLVLGGRLLLERVRPVAARAAAWGALVVLALAVNLAGNARAGYGFARDYARTVLESLAPNAVLFVHGDMDSFPIAYEHLAEGVRPDVALYNDQGLMFENRLASPRASLEERERAVTAFVQATDRPVYFTDSALPGFTFEEGGLWLKLRRDLAPGRRLFSATPALRAFAERMDQGEPRDTWTILRRDALRRRFARVLAYFRYYEPDRAAADGLGPALDGLQRSASGLLGTLDLLTTPDAGLDEAAILAVADRAEAQLGPDAAKADRAYPAYARGRVLRQRQAPGARGVLEESLAVYPSTKNPALLQLLAWEVDAGDKPAFYATIDRYVMGRPVTPAMNAQLHALRARLEQR